MPTVRGTPTMHVHLDFAAWVFFSGPEGGEVAE